MYQRETAFFIYDIIAGKLNWTATLFSAKYRAALSRISRVSRFDRKILSHVIMSARARARANATSVRASPRHCDGNMFER